MSERAGEPGSRGPGPSPDAERDRLAAALAEAEERFRVTLGDSPVGISISRVRDGLILEMNDAFLQILGFAREEAVGRTSTEIGLWTASDQRAAIVREFQEKGRVAPMPVRMHRRDGSVVTVLFSASRLGGGEEPRTIAWVMDISDRLRVEEALRTSEEKWRTLAESAPVVILTVDRAGTILSHNHSLSGRPPGDLIGKCLHDFAADAPDREHSRAMLAEVFASGAPVSFEIRAARPGGGVMHMRNVLAPLRDHAGEVVAAVGVGMDVTAEAEASAALRASEARWRSLVENIPAVISIIGRDGTVLSVNQTVTRRPREEVEGGSAFAFLPEGSRAAAREAVARVFVTGRAETIRLPVHGPGGALRWFEHRLTPVAADGATASVIALSTDIGAAVEAEAALRESEQRFRDIVHSLGDWVWEVDAQGRTTYSSPQVEDLLGYAAGEMLGKSPWDTCAPEERRRYLEGQEALTGNPIPFRDREIWHRHRDGRRVCLSVSGVPVRDPDGSLRGYRGVAHDVTERRREEEERRRLEAEVQQARRVESLGVLAGGIAHDFNNLLTAILGNAELALAELPEGGARPLVAQIQAAGLHAAELTRQMLAYAGRGRLAPVRVDLSDAVREMAQLLGASVPKKVALELDLAGGLPAVEADPAQLRQVVMNLVMNAADAIGDREGRIGVRTLAGVPEDGFRADLALGRVEEGRDLVCVDIEDSGSGIAPDALGKIFDPFFTTKFTGRGLGLAAVQGIVLRHGGSIAVRTEPGAGSIFRVCFPALPAGAGAAPAPAPASAAAPWRGRGTVLLVDDEAPVRSMATRMLRLLGLEVVEAADGRAAVAAAAEHPGLAAVLLDLTMPQMDGRETYRELRRLRPGLPVILCSGYDVLENADRFAGMDFAGFLQKPYRVEDLAQALRRAIEE